jgi:hypothetical protein
MKRLSLLSIILIPLISFSHESFNKTVPVIDTVKQPTIKNTILLGGENYTKSLSTMGGNYFSIGYARKLVYKFDIALKYSFDIVPESFKDNLFTLSLNYAPGRYSEGPRPSISVLYMTNVSDDNATNNYLGTKISLVNGLTKKHKTFIEILGFSFLYDFNLKDFIFCYDFLTIGIKF